MTDHICDKCGRANIRVGKEAIDIKAGASFHGPTGALATCGYCGEEQGETGQTAPGPIVFRSYGEPADEPVRV